MSTIYNLDPKQVGDLEPSEGDEGNRAMLSPYAIPLSIYIEGSGPGSFSLIRLQYSVSEAAKAAEQLDGETDPVVNVRTSLLSQKILELAFTPSAKVGDLTQIAKRLEEHANRIPSKAKKLSYRMTASLLGLVLPNMIHYTETGEHR